MGNSRNIVKSHDALGSFIQVDATVLKDRFYVDIRMPEIAGSRRPGGSMGWDSIEIKNGNLKIPPRFDANSSATDFEVVDPSNFPVLRYRVQLPSGASESSSIQNEGSAVESQNCERPPSLRRPRVHVRCPRRRFAEEAAGGLT